MMILKFIKKIINRLTGEPKSAMLVEQPPNKVIMKTQTEINPVEYVRDWAINKIDMLHDADRHRNADALLAEFDEWINLPDGEDEINYLCIEDDSWGDQEVEVQ